MKENSANEIFKQAKNNQSRLLYSKTNIVQRNIYVSSNKITVVGVRRGEWRGLGGGAWRVLAACLCVHVVLADIYRTSWHVYQEEQCCVAEGANKQDFVSEFTCGELFYRTLHLDELNGFLYVGAMEHVYRLQISNISGSDCKKDSIFLEATDTTECILSGKSEEFECRNHIRVIEDIGDNMLYVCGTNAYNPRDLIIYKDLRHLPRHVHRARVGRGAGRCPPSPRARARSLFARDLWAAGAGHAGTPPGMPPDPLLARWDFNNDTHVPPTHHGYLRTLKYDTKWMDNPEFISLQQFGAATYLFMRENSLCGPAGAVSVAARVCSHDAGGSRDRRHWTTYAKAKITCLTPHYDQLESIYRIPSSPHFYGVFTSGHDSAMRGSVVCAFGVPALERPFRGPFAERARPAPVPEERVPNPRPGSCVPDTTKLPDSVVNFLRAHPMMYEEILPEFDRPIYIQKDVIFTDFTVDKITNALNNYTVFYAATNDGRIFKIVQWITETPEIASHSFLQDIWRVFSSPQESTVSLALASVIRSLFVASDQRVVQIDLSGQCARYDGCVRCARDPYCGWNQVERVCKAFEVGLLQDVPNTSALACDLVVPATRVATTFGQSVHLGSYLHVPEVMKDGEDFTWSRYDGDLGRRQIIQRSGKYILTAGGGLVLAGLTHQDGGVFECRAGRNGGRLLARYNVTVDTNRCSPPAQNGSYQRVYLAWCREFTRHKEAMQRWQTNTKQQCKKHQLLDWNQQRSNDVIQNKYNNNNT